MIPSQADRPDRLFGASSSSGRTTSTPNGHCQLSIVNCQLPIVSLLVDKHHRLLFVRHDTDVAFVLAEDVGDDFLLIQILDVVSHPAVRVVGHREILLVGVHVGGVVLADDVVGDALHLGGHAVAEVPHLLEGDLQLDGELAVLPREDVCVDALAAQLVAQLLEGGLHLLGEEALDVPLLREGKNLVEPFVPVASVPGRAAIGPLGAVVEPVGAQGTQQAQAEEHHDDAEREGGDERHRLERLQAAGIEERHRDGGEQDAPEGVLPLGRIGTVMVSTPPVT